MRIAVVIPARLASTRLPGKVLKRDTGKYLVQHVHEAVLSAAVTKDVFIATDHPDVARACAEFGAACRLTGDLASGTDRVAAVAAELPHEIIINVQGDEPEMAPAHLQALAELMTGPRSPDVGTVAVETRDGAQSLDPNIVKAVCTAAGRALYFSRAPIPYPRATQGREGRWLRHLGLYGFRRAALARIAAAPPTELERTESLEQLRFLELGLRMDVAIVAGPPSAGIDTSEQYADFVARWRTGGGLRR